MGNTGIFFSCFGSIIVASRIPLFNMVYFFGNDGSTLCDDWMVDQESPVPCLDELPRHRMLDYSYIILGIRHVLLHMEVLPIGCTGRLRRNLLHLFSVKMDWEAIELYGRFVGLFRRSLFGHHVCTLFRDSHSSK